MDREETRLDRLERLFEETRKRFDDIGKRFDDLGLSYGRFAEGLVAPSLPRVFHRFDIKIKGYGHRESRRRNGTTMEVDILAPGTRDGRKVVVAVEVKTYLTATDVKAWLKKLDRFHDFFEEFRGHDLLGGVAGMQIDEEVQRHAARAGLFVIGPSEEVAEILNLLPFEPRVWPATKRGRRSE